MNNVAPKQTHVVSQWKHDSPLMRCRFDPRGDYAFSTAEDRSIQRWELATGKKQTFTAHDGWVWGLAVLPDDETLVSGGTDGRLIWWPRRVEKPAPMRTIQAHDGWVRYISVSPDGKLLATGGNDNLVRLWNVTDGTLHRELPGHGAHVYSTFFHPDGTHVLSGDLLGKIKQWEIATGKEVREFDGKALHTYNGGQRVHYGGVRSLSLSPDGKLLAASGLHKASNPLGAVNEPLVLLFEWASGQLARSCVSSVRGIGWRALFHPSGFLVGASGGGGGGFLLFWDPGREQAEAADTAKKADKPEKTEKAEAAETRKPFHQTKLPNTARDLDLHPDGVQLLTTHFDRHIRISRMEKKAAEEKKKG